MEESRAYIILGCIGLYLVMCISVGLWAMRRTKDTTDFFMAGRNLGVLVTGVAVFSSTMSGFGFVGGPGLVYRAGMSSLWMVICVTIGSCIGVYLLGKRLRLIGELRDTITLPDAIFARYGAASTAGLSAVAILLGVMGYLATQILAMATALQILLVDVVGHVPLGACVAGSCAVLVFYCVTGGIIASVYTDLVQGLVMVVAAVLVFLAAMLAVQGGFTGMSATILRDDPEAISPWGTIGILGCLSWFVLFSLGVSGQPHITTKWMMTRRVEDIRYVLPMGVIGYSITALLWIGIGLAMRALVLQGNHPSLANADAAAPEFLQHYTHPILAGVVFAGLFAAIMSTADSFLNIGAAAIVHDLPRALHGRSLENELLWARVGTVLIAVAASLFALYSGDMIALLGAFGWATFAAALVPTVTIGFNWKRATPMAANVAIVSGLVLNFSIRIAEKFFGFTMLHGIDPGVIALLTSLTLFFGISFASSPPRIDPDIEAVMDL